MAVEPSAAAARVSTPSGLVVGIPEGGRLVFGRGPDADLTIAAGRGLSRRAGVITAVGGGVWIANLSRTHALYTEGEGYRIRLPRMEEQGEPSGGWFLRSGTTLVGSRAMLDEGQPLRVMVSGVPSGWADGPDGRPGSWQDGDVTLLPLYLDPMTKIFLVALMWCRPWLLDPAGATPLPRTPEIAKAALEVDRRVPRTGPVRHRPGVPRSAVRPGRGTHQGAPPEDHRPRAGARRRTAVRRGGGPGADRARHHHHG